MFLPFIAEAFEGPLPLRSPLKTCSLPQQNDVVWLIGVNIPNIEGPEYCPREMYKA